MKLSCLPQSAQVHFQRGYHHHCHYLWHFRHLCEELSPFAYHLELFRQAAIQVGRSETKTAKESIQLFDSVVEEARRDATDWQSDVDKISGGKKKR